MTTQAYPSSRRPGWLTFAAIILMAISFVRVITAINYFGHGSQINDLSNTVYGQHLWVWGAWDLLIAALAFLGSLSLLSGHTFGRLLVYCCGVLLIVQCFLIIGAAPWFAIATILLAALTIHGVASASDWSREGS